MGGSSRQPLSPPDDWAQSSYGTHWHLLLPLFLRFHPRRILETGSGLYSTPFFLSFDIGQLVSLENNPEWLKSSGDPRHEVVEVDGPMVDGLPDLSGFDLVFVDDDPVEERPATLRAVLKSAPGLVVVHDTDHPPLHEVIGTGRITITAHSPTTTVLHPRRSKEFSAWLNRQG